MKKLSTIILSTFILLFSVNISANNISYNSLEDFKSKNNLNIISREQWGANEDLTFVDGKEWQTILTNRANAAANAKPLTESQKKAREEANKKFREKIDYFNTYYVFQNKLATKETNIGNRKLASVINKTPYVNAIIVHHTAVEYNSSEEGIKNILRSHAISNQWGDIGYNYVIGYNGEIYEGRKGGDYVEGAHANRNNRSTVGISVMGDYTKKSINESQKESLEKLIQMLTIKYGIDLNKDYDYHKDCSTCKSGIMTMTNKTLIGHRDAGNTTCPGDFLYAELLKIRDNNSNLTKGFKPVSINDTINPNIDIFNANLGNISNNSENSNTSIPYSFQTNVDKAFSRLSKNDLEKVYSVILYKLESPNEKDLQNKIYLEYLKMVTEEKLRNLSKNI